MKPRAETDHAVLVQPSYIIAPVTEHLFGVGQSASSGAYLPRDPADE